MSQRSKIIILLGVGCILLFVVVFVALAPTRVGQTPAKNQNVAAVNALPSPQNAALPAAFPLTKAPRTQSALEAVAVTFAERYGSYSSERQPDYLSQLAPLMTPRLAAVATPTLPAGSTFYGVTTKALSVQIVALNEAETEAQLVVQTQRFETPGGGAQPPWYQKITLTLVQFPGGWRVDRADWQ